MKKVLQYLAGTIIAVALIYGIGVIFFLNRFMFSAQYGKISLLGETEVSAKAKIESELNQRKIQLVENGQNVAEIKLGELNPSYDLDSAIHQAFEQQDPLMWPLSLVNPVAVKVEEKAVQVDSAAATAILETKGIQNAGRTQAIDAEVQYSEADGYTIKPDVKGTQIDPEYLAQQLALAGANGQAQVDLAATYADAKVTQSGEKVTQVMDMIKKTSETPFTYQIAGETVKIPAKTIEKWIRFDSNNQMKLDSEAVTAYLNSLNEKYATFGKERKFKSTLQGVVTVKPGILGWKIDVEKELPKLEADILAHREVKRAPEIYSTGGVANAKDDIGDTYVEVDVTNQMMFLYVKDKLILESPVVTGQPRAETVPGAGAITEMLSGTKLVGYNQFYRKDYSVAVNYWMRFDDQSQGIHDAPWQSAFGGDVWTYSGSLGCVNSPYDAAATIYNNVTYGTPVIVFY